MLKIILLTPILTGVLYLLGRLAKDFKYAWHHSPLFVIGFVSGVLMVLLSAAAPVLLYLILTP